MFYQSIKRFWKTKIVHFIRPWWWISGLMA